MRVSDLRADGQGGNVLIGDLPEGGGSLVDVALGEADSRGVALGEIDDGGEGDLRMGEDGRGQEDDETEESLEP